MSVQRFRSCNSNVPAFLFFRTICISPHLAHRHPPTRTVRAAAAAAVGVARSPSPSSTASSSPLGKPSTTSTRSRGSYWSAATTAQPIGTIPTRTILEAAAAAAGTSSSSGSGPPATVRAQNKICPPPWLGREYRRSWRPKRQLPAKLPQLPQLLRRETAARRDLGTRVQAPTKRRTSDEKRKHCC